MWEIGISGSKLPEHMLGGDCAGFASGQEMFNFSGCMEVKECWAQQLPEYYL